MIYAENLNEVQTCIDEKWVPAKVYSYSSFYQRLKDAWKVLKGEYIAVDFNYEKRFPKSE